MKFSTTLALGALASTALATDKVVKLDVTKTKSTKLPKAVGGGVTNGTKTINLQKRDKYVQDALADDGIGYFATLAVGTPEQTIRVQIDTGSSDLWFPGSNNPQCPEGTSTPIDDGNEDEDYCLKKAQFDSSASSSWKVSENDPAFYIEYVDGSFAKGKWGTDTVKWNDVTIDSFQFAAASDSNATSVFGIALEADEASEYSETGGATFKYPNWPVRLQSSGYIDKIVYSLFPNQDPYTTSGDVDITLLFGGVDSAKYSGSLMTFDMDSTTDLAIPLTGITTNIGGSSQSAYDGSISAVLDSGTTLQALPYTIVQKIAQSLGTSGDTYEDFYVVSCDSSSDDYIDYSFGSQTIKVPISAVIEEVSDGTCILAIMSTEELTILGDTFLTNAYVVYDLQDKEISIAQAKYTNKEDVQPVISTVPGATKAGDVSKPTA